MVTLIKDTISVSDERTSLIRNTISPIPGLGISVAQGQGGGVTPSGYGVFKIGSPASFQILRIGADSSAPRILISTGA